MENVKIRRANKIAGKPAQASVSRATSAMAAPLIPAIDNEQDYDHLMAEIEQLVIAGGGTIKNEDLGRYAAMAKTAYDYEHRVYTIDPPRTLEGLLEWKMYELKLKQKGLAEKLHVSDAKLSLVMSGKQRPDASLLKAIHLELGIDGNLLLDVI